MEVTNCKDINGNAITNIKLNTDGSVLAILVINGIETTSNLSYDCCTTNGYTFDPNDTKCYWSTSCPTDEDYKIIFSPEGDAGVIFQVAENQKEEVVLEVQLDYIIKFNCDSFNDTLKNVLEALKLDISLEKVIYDETLPIPNNLVSIKTEPLLNITNVSTFLSGNTNTGLLLNGTGCDALINNLIIELGPINSQYVTNESFNSIFVRHTMIIDEPELLDSIYDERLKIAIKASNLMNYSLLVDNIKLNKKSTKVIGQQFLKTDCPSFDLKRVIDNKKSWVSNISSEIREFDLSRRETKYAITNDRSSINTKEIDLLINPSTAIESDVFNFTLENPCILRPSSGCTQGTPSCVDLEALLTTPITEILDGNQLLSEIIDVKSRKTLRAYPTMELLYDRYINSQEHCGVASSALSSDSVNKFVDLIGVFWGDIIEQVVPATTIWGTSYKHGNNVFGSDKFKYRKSTLLTCFAVEYSAPSPTQGENTNVGVILSDITDNNYIGPPELAPSVVTQSCSLVSIVQIDDGSEFIGTISIIGGDGSTGTPTNGSTITINETIGDSCNIYNKGDFDPNDYDNNDWDTPN
jgi:hypothetical protein